jgi:immunoglobulin-binding protein 1
MDDYALILSLLPSSSSQESTSNSTAPSSSSEPESLRPYTISLLSLLYAQSLAQLDSIEQETQLLQSVPDDFEEREKTAGDGRERGREGDDEIISGWRLDSVNRGGPDGKGELMDGSGKVSRLSSSSLGIAPLVQT